MGGGNVHGGKMSASPTHGSITGDLGLVASLDNNQQYTQTEQYQHWNCCIWNEALLINTFTI